MALPSSNNKNTMLSKSNGINGTGSGILHRSLHSYPLKVIGAKGNYLFLSNGRKILDATGGAAVACLGHGDDRVRSAIAKQQHEVSYCHSLFFSTTAGEDLGHLLIDSTDGKMAKAFIVSSGKSLHLFVQEPVPDSLLPGFICRI
jgi:adenosylmethionine-8-amino-7-oxononanoate aminotransferase